MWCLFFSNNAHAHGAFDNTHVCHCAGHLRPDRRGRYQRGHASLAGESTPYLSLARATQWRKNTLRLCAWTQQWLPQRIAGEALYTRVNKQGAPDAAQGWTVVLRARATRFMGDRPWGRQERTLLNKAMRLVGHVIEPPGTLTLLTEGERRSGSLGLALGSAAVRTGKRGRPQQTLCQGGNVRRKHQGSQRHKRGPKRPKYQAPSPEHPQPAQSLATPAMPANHLAAFTPSLRRRGAAYRRRTHRYAKTTGRLQERLDVSWMVPHFVRVHFTIRRVPAVA
jgi:hypothetical protein